MPNLCVSFFRSTTMCLTLLRQQCDWDKCSEIVPGLFLGSLPINKAPCGKGKRFTNTLQQISQFVLSKNPERPLRLIVPVIESDELEGKGFVGVETIKESELKKSNIERIRLNMCDYDRKATVNYQEAANLLRVMHHVISEKQSVYIHCKAGCERSAMFSACYLAAFVINPKTGKNFSIEEAVSFLKGKRKQVTVRAAKLRQAKKILEELTKKTLQKTPPIQNTSTQTHSYYDYVSNLWHRNKKFVVATALSVGVAITTAYRMGQ